MNWHELTIRTSEEAAEAVADWLRRSGANGVAIEEPWDPGRARGDAFGAWYEPLPNGIPAGEAVLQAYFPEGTDMEELAERARSFLARLPGFGLAAGRAEVAVKTVREEDWADAWKQYFKPIRISERLVVKPTWENYDAGPRDIVVELDPGMAFGTGAHATTALCMRMLERHVRPGDHVVDVGTGSGILAIAAARLGAERVLALDLDPVAVASARENVRLNGLEDRIAVAESDLLGILKENGSANGGRINVSLPVRIVAANILAEIIAALAGDAHAALAGDGVFIASGIIADKEAEVSRALEAAGFVPADRAEEGGWVALAARKRGPR